MDRLVINIKDKTKEEALINFLRELPFIDIEESTVKNKSRAVSSNFRKLFGIWKDRDVSLNEIRDKAWPKSNL
jgi:hypothetical protein